MLLPQSVICWPKCHCLTQHVFVVCCFSNFPKSKNWNIKNTTNCGGRATTHHIFVKIHSFFYTTSGGGNDLSGFGHGLGLSQIYVRYFGGDIKIIPMEGSGTQVIIYFSNFTNNSENVADDFN